MFELFNAEARRVVVLSQEAAKSLKHKQIGPEHLLLGLLGEGEGFAARVLTPQGIDHDRVLAEVVRARGRSRWLFKSYLRFTPETKNALEQSLHESIGLQHSYIGAEHLLLGLLHDGHGPAAQILRNLGAPPELVREQVNRVCANRSNDIRE
ncbi:ClpA/ClpB-like protein [Nocardiopsis sp. Huas11]|uniref:Clp protease N-terminal domain-containing protein n=1 Tax=Nocardiopsis sp. Huas11 TaxID=2183912 RepID=UPI000EB2C653|nr:Clp protease N-terminal domain-containing protein [Nocardiopsis sp. Huas11]RKS07069.1 ClpA/ClpB-like protein [Nocardiopsis sp. Huas11]